MEFWESMIGKASLRKGKSEFRWRKRKNILGRGNSRYKASLWKGAWQEYGTKIRPIWLEHKEQGKKNMAQAMAGKKGRGQTMQDLVRHVDATT